VIKARNFEEHKKFVEEWTKSAYNAWSKYHSKIDGLVGDVLQ
jgi:hypothetical protein